MSKSCIDLQYYQRLQMTFTIRTDRYYMKNQHDHYINFFNITEYFLASIFHHLTTSILTISILTISILTISTFTISTFTISTFTISILTISTFTLYQLPVHHLSLPLHHLFLPLPLPLSSSPSPSFFLSLSSILICST